MGFGTKRTDGLVSADRLAAVGGGVSMSTEAAAQAPSSPRLRGEIQPDLSRIRPRAIDESPEDRKRRLAAKTVNFSMTILARLVIVAGAGLYAWKQYQFTGQLHRGVAIGVFAMFADLGRVVMKASEPGTK